MEDFFLKYGLKSAHFLIGLIGGGLVVVIGGNTVWTIRSVLYALAVMTGGAVVTMFGTPLVIHVIHWDSVEYSVAFFVGILGMGITKGFLKIVSDFSKNPYKIVDYIISIYKKITGKE